VAVVHCLILQDAVPYMDVRTQAMKDENSKVTRCRSTRPMKRKTDPFSDSETVSRAVHPKSSRACGQCNVIFVWLLLLY